jgi:hypothetical protein
MVRISRLVCGLALVFVLFQAIPKVQAQSQDLIVDICTTPNKYWNKAVALKGHVIKVTPDPPGTNRGRYTMRDQSDKDIEIATEDLPSQGKIYIVHGNVEQRKAGDNIPIVREESRNLAQMDTPMTAPAVSRTAPAPIQSEPSPARTAAPASKGLSKAEIAEAVRNEIQKSKATEPAPAPVAAAPAPAPVEPPPAASMMENPLVVGGIVIVILAIVAIVIVAMRKKPAPAPAAYAPAPTQMPVSQGTMASSAATQVSSGAATMVASKGTEVFTRLGGELSVTEGPDRGRNFVIGKPTTLIGRTGQRKNDLELSDSTTSREQAKIIYSPVDRSFKIINESTTNPTRVNSATVDAVVLQDGDRIEFGNTVVRFKKT